LCTSIFPIIYVILTLTLFKRVKRQNILKCGTCTHKFIRNNGNVHFVDVEKLKTDDKLGHKCLICAAIDFGTTFSGYAYSTRDDFIRDPLKISTNQKWIAGTGNLVSLKTASCILLDPDKNFKAFGFEAEDQYNEMLEFPDGDDYMNHYFFQKFKMKLFSEDDVSILTTHTS